MRHVVATMQPPRNRISASDAHASMPNAESAASNRLLAKHPKGGRGKAHRLWHRSLY